MKTNVYLPQIRHSNIPHKASVMASVCCQLNRLQNCLGDTPLGVPVGDYPDCLTWKTHPLWIKWRKEAECQHTFVITLCFLIVSAVTKFLELLLL